MKNKRSRNNKKFSNKGITLIALIITIIILLILTGISILTLTGENGLLKKAKEAGEKTIEAQIKEEIELAIIEIQAEELPKRRPVTLETLANNQLTSQLQDITANLENNEIIGEYKGYDYIIDDKFKVTIGGKVKGISITYKLSNEEYTNQDITLTIHATSTNGEITKIEEPMELTKNSDNTYTITKNGEYEFTVTDSMGKVKTKLIKITNIDKIGPIVELSTGKITASSIELNVTAIDEQSGLALNNTYEYYLEDILKTTSVGSQYNYTDLTSGTSYHLKVIVTDKAGNRTEKSIETKTSKSVTELKAGDTVNYIDNNGDTIKCRVLYDSSSNYGIQIISELPLEGVGVKIGNGTGSQNDTTQTDLFYVARDSYNNAIQILNAKANEYLNAEYASSARCVGTLPDNPNLEVGYHTSGYSWYVNHNETLKDADTNYLIDWNQMTSLGIANINGNYWVASRNISNDKGVQFRYAIRYFIGYSSQLIQHDICKIAGYVYSADRICGIRPVFTLKSEIQVTGGEGTSNSPYTLNK